MKRNENGKSTCIIKTVEKIHKYAVLVLFLSILELHGLRFTSCRNPQHESASHPSVSSFGYCCGARSATSLLGGIGEIFYRFHRLTLAMNHVFLSVWVINE